MTTFKSNESYPVWSNGEKIAFRFVSIFLFLLAFPLDWKYWKQLPLARWPHFQDLFRLTVYNPQFISAPKWGLASYVNWGLWGVLAIVGGLVWSYLDRTRREYSQLYYWLRVLLRYRLAIGLFGYGVLKLFPLQFPHVTLSELNTNYMDFLPWKIYYLTNGAAAADYQQALGLIEVAGGILLLWRRTATLGAGVAAALLSNIVLVNFAYQIGDHVYASSLLLIALFLLAHDLPRLYNLVVRERLAVADSFDPIFATSRTRNLRILLKSFVLLFLVVYGASTYASYRHSNWPFSETPGLKDTAGLYNVREFVINGNTLPYSLIDPVRWQNVVFEKWNTVSVRIHRPASIDIANPPIAYEATDSHEYEIAGNGGRHFYSYTADPVKHTILLQGENDKRESFSLQYKYLDNGSILLTGSDQSGNSLRIVLDKIDKKYLYQIGRRKPVKVY
jgi:hypothetical protein